MQLQEKKKTRLTCHQVIFSYFTLMEEIVAGRNFRGWSHTVKILDFAEIFFADVAISQISLELNFADTGIKNKKISDKQSNKQSAFYCIRIPLLYVVCKYCSQNRQNDWKSKEKMQEITFKCVIKIFAGIYFRECFKKPFFAGI